MTGEKDANRGGEDLDRAARESYRATVDRAFAARESNMGLSRSFFEDWIDALEAQAEFNRHALKSLAGVARGHQVAFLQLYRESLEAYGGFLDSLYREEKPGESEKDG